MMIIILWLVFLGIDVYHKYWPIKVIEYHFDEARVLNPDKKVKRGGYLEWEFKYSKYIDINGEISRSLVNDRIIHLTDQRGATPPGINKSKIIETYIPQNIFPGKYRMMTIVNFPVYHDRMITTRYKTEEFEVVE